MDTAHIVVSSTFEVVPFVCLQAKAFVADPSAFAAAMPVAAAPVESKEEETKAQEPEKEESEESDDDMGIGMMF